MKALLAFDKYKGSLSASEACAIAAEAIREYDESIEIHQSPLSDGGEGFCEIVTTALKGVFRDYRVTFPDLRTGCGRVGYVFLDKLSPRLLEMLDLPPKGLLAIVEMAQAAGHHLVSNSSRNPWHYTSAGVGELIRYAQVEGATAILLGVGGSATNDMGVGILEAFGLRGYTSDGHLISPLIPFHWNEVVRFEAPPGLPDLNVRIACDVRNPLHGSNGAAAVFGPQKGLKAEDQESMQRQMRILSERLLHTHGFRTTDAGLEGMGAAGGLPFSLSLAFETHLIPGFELTCEILKLIPRIQAADIVFTGEGALDKSSLSGKGPYEVVRKACEFNKWVAVLPGKAFPEARDHLTALHPKVKVLQVGLEDASLEENIQNEATHLRQRVQTVLASIPR